MKFQMAEMPEYVLQNFKCSGEKRATSHPQSLVTVRTKAGGFVHVDLSSDTCNCAN